MKKTGFFLTAVLLAAMLVFTGCGSRDDNSDAVPDSEQNSVTEDIKDGYDFVFVARAKTPFVKCPEVQRSMRKQLKEAGVLK